MAFWSVTGPEPKRQYRWYVEFGGTGESDLGQIKFALKKVDKPKAKVGEITHKYLNHFFYYPGRLEWEAINMTFASVTDPDASYILNQVLLNAGYGVPTDATTPGDQVSTIGKNKFNTAIGTKMSIIQIDAEGGIIETWEINKPFFTSVQFGSLDYGSEEIVEISTTVRYDWARLITPQSVNGNVTSDPNIGLNPGFPDE